MANRQIAPLGTSAPIITIDGLSHEELMVLSRHRQAKEAKEAAKASKEAIRARVMDRAIALLSSKTLVVLGQEMDGITAVQYHLAFSGMNYKAPTELSQSVIDVTWPFLRELQEQMGGVDHFLINSRGLAALLLEGAPLSNSNKMDFESGE